MKTRERILETALRMFNEKGVHSVGVRDIARELGISPGNLQYHFARKDLLVLELVRAVHVANNARVEGVDPATISFRTVHELSSQALRAHIPYRGILIAYAELVAASPALQELAHEMDAARPQRADKFFRALADNGSLDLDRLGDRGPYLRQQIEQLGRFWIVGAGVAGRLDDLEAYAEERARLILQLWEPYATPAGRNQIDEILNASEVGSSGP